jgi:tetratricopeptide (TPR) repeat protein
LAADPNCAQAYGALAATLGTEGRFDLAEDALQRAVQLDPNDASAHATLGWIFGAQRQWDRAQAEFRQACRLDPDDADSLTWFGVACASSGKRDEATGLLELAVSLDRTNALAHAHLASAYADGNQKEQARRELAEARHYLAEGIPAGNALIIMGDTYGSLGERSDAIDCYERTLVLAKERAVNPATLRLLEQRIQRIKSTLSPTFIEARPPQRYTSETLDAILRERLSETERDLAPNPFSCTEPMRAWAQELTRGVTSDLGKAKAIFEALAARPNSGGQPRSRVAREVFAAWRQADTRLVCMDLAVLFVALARAVDVDAFFTNVTALPDGTVVNHACAAVFVDQRALLADPTLRWFGIPHQQYEILDDLQTAAFLCFNNREGDSRDLAACRAGLKLWPDSLQGQLCLASALGSANHLEEVRQILARVGEPQVKDYRAATYWGLQALVAVEEHDWKAAEAHLLKAVSLYSGSASLQFNLGQLYWERHRWAEARTAFRACLRNDPHPMTAGIARQYIAQINEKIGVDAAAGALSPEQRP